MVTGLRMMRPSATSFRTVWRELALLISETSLGSSQILRSPQPSTADARRFWVRRLTLRLTRIISTRHFFVVRSGFVAVVSVEKRSSITDWLLPGAGARCGSPNFRSAVVEYASIFQEVSREQYRHNLHLELSFF